MGWTFFGIVMLILAGLVAMFPENMKNQNAAGDSECRKVANKKVVEEETSLEGNLEYSTSRKVQKKAYQSQLTHLFSFFSQMCSQL